MVEPRTDAITWPTPDQFPRQVAENIAQLTGPKAEEFSIIHNGWGLFEQTWRLRGFENMLMDCIGEEDFYRALLDKLTELRLGMVAQCKDVPADAIMFGDDWGDQRGIIIGPDRWRKLLKPRWAKVFAATRAQGKYSICHCCGSNAQIIPDLIEIGLDVLESVQPEPAGMDSFELKRKFGDKITFWGCLGSQSTVPFGTPREIKARVAALCEVMGKGGGFILAPAKAIQPGTPPENSLAVVEAFATQNL
jgi:uroporphyrinogen decarboxylase